MTVNYKARHQARRHLLQALYQWQVTRQPLRDLEQQFLLALTGKTHIDSAYFQDNLTAILTNLDHIDQAFAPFLSIEQEKIDPIELSALRLATHELLTKPEIPYKVVINEALELTKVFGSVDGFKFINGVLDKTAATLRDVEFRSNHTN